MMRGYWPIPVAVFAAACLSDGHIALAQLEASPVTCDDLVLSLKPVDRSQQVLFVDPLVVRASRPDDIELLLVDAHGDQVPVERHISEDGRLVSFFHDGLQPEMAYTAGITSCLGYTESRFETSTIGYPIGNLAQLDRRTYLLDIGSGTTLEPRGFDDVAVTASQSFFPLVQFHRDDDGTLRLMTAAGRRQGDGVEQHPCGLTGWLDGEMAFERNPVFHNRSNTLDYVWSGVDYRFDHVTLSGALTDDLERIVGLRLEGYLDTRPLSRAVFPDQADEALCRVLKRFDVDCGACPERPNSHSCVRVSFRDLIATAVNVPDLVETDRDQALAHWECRDWAFDPDLDRSP